MTGGFFIIFATENSNKMKKNLLLAALIAQGISAQITSYDNSFPSNGKHTIAEASISRYNNIIQNPDIRKRLYNP